MPENSANVEIAHRIHEEAGESGEVGERPGRRREEILEIAQAVLLALVAIATAFSGYQAARWDSNSAQLYGQSSRLRSMAAQAQNQAGQLYLYDTTTFDFWLNATVVGQAQLASIYEARFRPEYRVAFDAWIALNPLQNPGTPPGPSFMPQYHVEQATRAASLDASASSAFDSASTARDHGDEYVRVTVFLAAVLFLVAVSQRFRIVGIRLSVLAVALVFLAYSVYTLALLPRA
ncbi:MAG TPA: hypothetical protein VE953_21210 [Terriglobales bacterium]|nr:hypothetical protein [Terriglobales bacterium]